MGLHRFYLRSILGLRLHPGLPRSSSTPRDVIRDRREDVSRTRAALERRSIRARPREDSARRRRRRPQMHERLTKAEADAAQGQSRFRRRRKPTSTRWHGYSRWLAILMAAMLLGRRGAAAGPGAQARTSARPRSAPTRRPRWCRAGRAADRHARGSDARICTRASPTRSNGSTSASASSSPIGR